ncbi:MAG TPA: glycogen debranching protein GlgX, partial [Baekduia sp.]|nr:glycogen debranching protein GlgX [Baekduia sp.]
GVVADLVVRVLCAGKQCIVVSALYVPRDTLSASRPRLGAHADHAGVTFAVFSSVADGVEVCLFDDSGRETRHGLRLQEGSVWAAHVEGVLPGRRYGFRVHGPWDPSRGLRCNPAKLLLDPYARAIDGDVSWHPAVYGHRAGAPDQRDDMDSAPYVPRSVVCATGFDWSSDRPPGIALPDSIVYELHVKGFTKRHPEIPEALRGTYAGLGHPVAIDHLLRLGVTAVELLPVHQFVHDALLVARGLRNYWGYQSVGFFAPHSEYASGSPGGGQVVEFKAMVKALHAAGLEVILDVVFNHSAEGGEDGPTLSLRGLDNAAYYRLQDDRRLYVDDTGCGNTLDTHRPQALRLVMDALRYWTQVMHVDGFRFDLATALGRGTKDFDPIGAFLLAVGQDPVLAGVKLIAEPWDVGVDGYGAGDFPAGWSEWNGRYRDDVRDFWRGQEGMLPEFATRVAGSADLYGHGGRRPTASINIVTVHDGFTLADLVSYDAKHNAANGEDNRDGTDDNRSWNCGAEGPTDDPAILELRARQRRNLLATLLLSEGVPMLLAGDELGRTQGGNNNAYCQDNPTSWLDWAAAGEQLALIDFVAALCRLRRGHPAFRRRQFFRGASVVAGSRDDVNWFRPDGEPMTAADWRASSARAVTVALGGAATDNESADTSFLGMVNGWWEPLTFRLPANARGALWSVAVDTAATPRAADASSRPIDPAAGVELVGRSLLLLQGSAAS